MQLRVSDLAELFTLLFREVEDSFTFSEQLARPHNVETSSERIARRHDPAMRLQYVGHPPSSRNCSHRQNDEIAAEMDVHDIEAAGTVVKPFVEPRSAHARATEAGKHGSSREQSNRNPVQQHEAKRQRGGAQTVGDERAEPCGASTGRRSRSELRISVKP
jgi:hypothetical protein